MTTSRPFATPEDLVGRLMESTAAAMDIFAVYVGEALGYYEALHDRGPATSAELAARTGTHERYAREWLEQQATTGLLAVDDPAAAHTGRRYCLPKGYASVLVDRRSELFAAPLGRFIVGTVGQTPQLLQAYRTGGGVSWAQYGDLARTAQADFNRPFYEHQLVPSFLKAIPEVQQALSRPGACVAEIGCGAGWASIAIARGYPQARVDGFDIDVPSVEMARTNLARSGVEDRVRFHDRDAADLDDGPGDGGYDLVCAFECVHDMPDPIAVLRAMRHLAKPGATVLVMDEAVGERFGDRDDVVERLLYGFSLTVCLPDGLSHSPSVGTGTVMRPDTLREYARAAGYRDIEVLPLEHDLFRFYRLVLPDA